MPHDPLCPCAPIDPIRPGAVHTTNSASCQCVLIARVRADERNQAGQRVMSLPNGASLSVAAAVASGDVDAGVGW